MIGWLAASLIAAAWASIGIWAVAYKERREREHRGHMDRIFEAVVAERDDLRASLHAVRQDLGDAVTLLRKERKDCANLRERLEIAQREERAWRRRAERAGLWTAVADALPDDPDEEVTVIVGGVSGNGYYRRGVWQSRHGLPMSGVTHWARLPGSGVASGAGGGEDLTQTVHRQPEHLRDPLQHVVTRRKLAVDPRRGGDPCDAAPIAELGDRPLPVNEEVAEGPGGSHGSHSV